MLVDGTLSFQSGETVEPIYSTTWTRIPTKHEAEQIMVSMLSICLYIFHGNSITLYRYKLLGNCYRSLKTRCSIFGMNPSFGFVANFMSV